MTSHGYKQDTLRPLIIASVLLGTALLWLFFNLSHFIILSQQKDHIDAQRYHLITLKNAVLEAETGQRGYLITNNVTFLEAFDHGKSTASRTDYT